MKMSEQKILNAKFATVAILFVVFAAIIGLTLGLYSNVETTPNTQVGTGASSQETGSQTGSTAVLGATDAKGLAVISATLQPDGSYLVQITNSSETTIEFSPGLQLYAVQADGSSVPISSLDKIMPLSGGPLGPSMSASGKVNFSTGSSIRAIRLYDTAQKSSYVDYPVL